MWIRFQWPRCWVCRVGLYCSLLWSAQGAWWPDAIVHPADPTDTERFAAAELQRYTEEMTGRLLPVRSEQEEEATASAMYVGRVVAMKPWASLTEHELRTIETDTAVWVPDGDNLYLFGGGDRGTLYAVYAFLERQGCRWFAPGPAGTYVPELETLERPDEVVIEQPVFAVREVDRGADSPEEAEQVIDWAVKNRLNRIFNLRFHPAWAMRGGQVQWQHICHNSPWLLPNDPWFETHPEYFSLFNGRRIPQAMEGGYLCTTNPDVQERVAAFIRNWFDHHPEGDAVPVSPPDGDVKWCECDDCMALGGVNFATGAEGHMTRRQVEFINAVAERVAETHPDRYIVNLAYSRYVWPYDGMRTARNVINQVAHGYAGNGSLVHSIYSDWNEDARDIFQQWSDSGGAGIGIWDYFILHVPDRSGSPMTPLGFAGVARDMIRFLSEFPQPYKVYFTQAGAELHTYNEFLYYVIARFLSNPTQSLAALRDDYAQTRFGVAADPVAAFYALLDEAYAAADWNPPIWRDITVPSARVFTPEVIEEGWALLNEAEARLTESGPRPQQALQRLLTSWQYVEATVLPKQLMAAADGSWRLERLEDRYVFNPGAPAGHEETWHMLRERAEEQGLLDASMERVLFRARSREEPIVWLENERLRLGVLPGVGGRLIRLYDRQHDGNLFFEPLQLTGLSDPGATYFRYGGYEEYTRSAFASPGWELAMDATLQTVEGYTVLSMEAVTPEAVRLKRRVRMADGSARTFDIHTTLTNEGDAVFPAMIRVHPEFQLTLELADTLLFYRTADGERHLLPVTAVATMDELAPDGYWGLIDRLTGQGIIHAFDSRAATAHVHIDRAYQSLNLELFGQAQDLQPGKTVQLHQQYTLLGSVEEWTPEWRALWEAQRQERVDLPLGFTPVPGVVGSGARVHAPATPQVGRVANAISKAGTFEAWVKLDAPPAAQHDALIMSAGTRQPDYMVLAVREGQLVFYRFQRTDDGERFEAWVKVEAAVPDWPAGEWQHVAVTWANHGLGQSEVALFVNGKSLIHRADLDMVPLKEPIRLAIGWDASNASRPRLPGALDMIRLYPVALTGDQVTTSYTAGRAQQAVPVIPDVLLKLDDFEDQAP